LKLDITHRIQSFTGIAKVAMTSANIPGLGWSTPSASFQLGKKKTLVIPMTLHAAARIKVRGGYDQRGIKTGICLLKGGDEMFQYDSDIELLFR
jgi:hypothetical protein